MNNFLVFLPIKYSSKLIINIDKVNSLSIFIENNFLMSFNLSKSTIIDLDLDELFKEKKNHF